MDLLHADRLLAQRLHHVAQVVGTLDDPRHPVGGARGRRYEVVAGAGVEHPLDLEAHGCLEPLSGCSLDHPGGEAALASAMRLAGLGAPVDRCPGPSRLSGEPHEPAQVRVEAEVAHGSGRRLAGGDRVVDHEDVEYGGHADSRGNRRRELARGDPFDPGDAAVVDIGERDRLDAGLRQGGGQLLGILRLQPLAFCHKDLPAAVVRVSQGSPKHMTRRFRSSRRHG